MRTRDAEFEATGWEISACQPCGSDDAFGKKEAGRGHGNTAFSVKITFTRILGKSGFA